MVKDTVINGYKKKILVTDDMEPYEYHQGIVVGPPDLSRLGLPEEVEIVLNNELFIRGIITKRDTIKGREEMFSALQYAFSVTVDRIMECY